MLAALQAQMADRNSGVNEMGNKTRRKSHHPFRLSMKLFSLDSPTINLFASVQGTAHSQHLSL